MQSIVEAFDSLEKKDCNPSVLAAIAPLVPTRSPIDNPSSMRMRKMIQSMVKTEVERI